MQKIHCLVIVLLFSAPLAAQEEALLSGPAAAQKEKEGCREYAYTEGAGWGYLVWHRFTPDGTKMMTGEQRKLAVWDLATGKELYHVALTDPQKYHSTIGHIVAVSPDCTKIAARFHSDKLTILNAADGKEIQSIAVGSTASGIFSPDASRFVQCVADPKDKHAATLHCWNTADGKEEWNSAGSFLPETKQYGAQIWRNPHLNSGFPFSDDGTKILTSGEQHNVGAIRDAATGKILGQTQLMDKNYGGAATADMQFSADAKHIFALYGYSGIVRGDYKSAIWIWDAGTGKFLREVDIRREPYGRHVFYEYSPDGKKVFCCFDNLGRPAEPDIKLIDLESGKVERQHRSKEEKRLLFRSVAYLRFLPDGKRCILGLTSSSTEGPAFVIWNTDGFAERFVELPAYTPPYGNVNFELSPDGKKFAYFYHEPDAVEKSKYRIKWQIWDIEAVRKVTK